MSLRSFVPRYLVGQSLSLLGNWVQMLALYVFVQEHTRSAVALSWLSVTGNLALILTLAWAGRFGDRVGRRRLWLIAQLGVASLATGLAVLTWAGGLTPFIAFVVTGLGGIIAALDSACRQAYLVDTLGARRTHQGIALDAVTLNLARTLGPLIAAGVLVQGHPAWAFLANALSSMVVWYLIAGHALPVPTVAPPPLPARLPLVWAPPHAWLQVQGLYALAACAGQPLIAQYAAWNTTWHGTPWTLAWLYGAGGLGALVGNLRFGRSTCARSRLRGISRGLLAIAVGSAGSALAHSPMAASVALTITGWGIANTLSGLQNAGQHLVDPGLRAEGSARLQRAYLIAAMIASVLVGSLAARWGYALGWTLCAGLALLAAVVARRTVPGWYGLIDPPAHTSPDSCASAPAAVGVNAPPRRPTGPALNDGDEQAA